jgi:hypothetical protein
MLVMPTSFFTSIAVQLAGNAQPLQRGICDAIAERNDIAGQSLRGQWNQLRWQDRLALGRCYRSSTANAQGSFGFGLGYGLFAGR